MITAKRVAIATAIAIAMAGAELSIILIPGLSVPVPVRVVLANMNLAPFALAVRLAGGPPNVAVVGILAFVQWFLVGFLLAVLFDRRRRPDSRR